MSFNWTQLAVGHEHAHVATLGLASASLLGMGLYARSKLGKGEEAIIPAGKFSLRGIFELNVDFISRLVIVTGKQIGRAHV